MLAQREAHQEQTRHKATDREAAKEQRRKEKEAKDLQVHAKKDARATKKLETERLQAERCARREGGGQDRGRASDGGHTSARGDEVHMLPALAQVRTTPPAPMMWPPASGGSPFFLNPTLMMAPHFTQPFQRSHDFNGHPWITQSSTPGGGESTVGSQVPAVQFMAPDSGGSGTETHGMGTWQSNLWGM